MADLLFQTPATRWRRTSRDVFEARVHFLKGRLRRAHQQRERHYGTRNDDRAPGEDDLDAKTVENRAQRTFSTKEHEEEESRGHRRHEKWKDYPAVSKTAFPGQSRRARSQAIAIPRGRIKSVLRAEILSVKKTICQASPVMASLISRQ